MKVVCSSSWCGSMLLNLAQQKQHQSQQNSCHGCWTTMVNVAGLPGTSDDGSQGSFKKVPQQIDVDGCADVGSLTCARRTVLKAGVLGMVLAAAPKGALAIEELKARSDLLLPKSKADRASESSSPSSSLSASSPRSSHALKRAYAKLTREVKRRDRGVTSIEHKPLKFSNADGDNMRDDVTPTLPTARVKLTFDEAIALVQKHSQQTLTASRKADAAVFYRGEPTEEVVKYSSGRGLGAAVVLEEPDLFDPMTYGSADAAAFFRVMDGCLQDKQDESYGDNGGDGGGGGGRTGRSRRRVNTRARPGNSHIVTGDKVAAGRWGEPVVVWPLEGFTAVLEDHDSDGGACGDVVEGQDQDYMSGLHFIWLEKYDYFWDESVGLARWLGEQQQQLTLERKGDTSDRGDDIHSITSTRSAGEENRTLTTDLHAVGVGADKRVGDISKAAKRKAMQKFLAEAQLRSDERLEDALRSKHEVMITCGSINLANLSDDSDDDGDGDDDNEEDRRLVDVRSMMSLFWSQSSSPQLSTLQLSQPPSPVSSSSTSSSPSSSSLSSSSSSSSSSAPSSPTSSPRRSVASAKARTSPRSSKARTGNRDAGSSSSSNGGGASLKSPPVYLRNAFVVIPATREGEMWSKLKLKVKFQRP